MSAKSSLSLSVSSLMNFMMMSILLKNCFWALNSFAYFSSRLILWSRTIYWLMSFCATPKVESDSRTFFAFVYQLVHSPAESIAGTNSAFIRLKSQLLPKLLIMIFKVSATFSFTNFTSSSFDFVAFKTQI